MLAYFSSLSTTVLLRKQGVSCRSVGLSLVVLSASSLSSHSLKIAHAEEAPVDSAAETVQPEASDPAMESYPELPSVEEPAPVEKPVSEPEKAAAPPPKAAEAPIVAPTAIASKQDSSTVETEKMLETAEKEDSGRGLQWFSMNGYAGAEYVNLGTVSYDSLLPALIPSTAFAPSFGAYAGIQLVFLTIGARFRYTPTPDWDLYKLAGQIGIHIPVGSVEPYFDLGFGYAGLGGVKIGDTSYKDASASGYNLYVDAGVDFYLSSAFSLGFLLSVDTLMMSRDGIPPTTDTGQIAGELAQDGSSVGFSVSLGATAGLHF